MSKTYYDRYMPIEVHSVKASAAQAAANKVIFTLPYMVQGTIAQVKAADHTLNDTGLKIEVKEDATTKVVTVEVSVTALLADQIVSLVAFK